VEFHASINILAEQQLKKHKTSSGQLQETEIDNGNLITCKVVNVISYYKNNWMTVP